MKFLAYSISKRVIGGGVIMVWHLGTTGCSRRMSRPTGGPRRFDDDVGGQQLLGRRRGGCRGGMTDDLAVAVELAEGGEDDANVREGLPPDEVGTEVEMFLGDVDVAGAGDDETFEASFPQRCDEVGPLENAALRIEVLIDGDDGTVVVAGEGMDMGEDGLDGLVFDDLEVTDVGGGGDGGEPGFYHPAEHGGILDDEDSKFPGEVDLAVDDEGFLVLLAFDEASGQREAEFGPGQAVALVEERPRVFEPTCPTDGLREDPARHEAQANLCRYQLVPGEVK